ncbi:MAG: hypothetical protein WC966_00480 [Bradymonadales bacterium]
MDANRIAMIKATLKYTTQEAFIEGIAPLISRAGLFIRTRSTRPIGTEVHFEFRLADDSQVYIGEGVVRKEIPFVGGPSSQMSGMLLSLNRINRPFKEVVDAVLKAKEIQEHKQRGGLTERDSTPPAMEAAEATETAQSSSQATDTAASEATQDKPKLHIVEAKAGDSLGFDLFGETDIDAGLDDLFAGVGLAAPELSATRSSGENLGVGAGFEVSGVYEEPRDLEANASKDYLAALVSANEELRSDIESAVINDDDEPAAAVLAAPNIDPNSDQLLGEDETSESLLSVKRVSEEVRGVSLLGLSDSAELDIAQEPTLLGMVDPSHGGEDDSSQQMQELLQQMQRDEDKQEQDSVQPTPEQTETRESISELLGKIEDSVSAEPKEREVEEAEPDAALLAGEGTQAKDSAESRESPKIQLQAALSTKDAPETQRRSFLDDIKLNDAELPKRQNVRSLGNIPVENPTPKKGGLFDKLFKK